MRADPRRLRARHGQLVAISGILALGSSARRDGWDTCRHYGGRYPTRPACRPTPSTRGLRWAGAGAVQQQNVVICTSFRCHPTRPKVGL